jgi:hypothetical protein
MGSYQETERLRAATEAEKKRKAETVQQRVSLKILQTLLQLISPTGQTCDEGRGI